jgi:hypothetical protein
LSRFRVGSRLHQPPTTNNQPPTTNNQPPTTNNQQPTTEYLAFPPNQRYLITAMFDVIKSQLSQSGDKLSHLRRFL